MRFLLADDSTQSPKAKALFELAQAGKLTLAVSHVTLAEVSRVLLSCYDFEQGKLAQTLRELVLHEGVEVDDSDVMLDAFDRFGKVSVDFIDCYMAALAKGQGAVMVTEDRDFRKFPDVVARRPDETAAWWQAEKSVITLRAAAERGGVSWREEGEETP